MAVSLDSDVLKELNSAEAQQLHSLTKGLSGTGVGSIVDLPQIVVFGGQNTGKSSVLEAISHIRFPIDSGLCTRFATELELKQAPESRIRASVRFADGRESKRLSYDGFQESDLPDIIRKAKDEMGLSGTGKKFSRDVLRLDIEGPSMYPLQLVDLPGVFSVNTADQSEEDIKTVNELVGSYLKQKNSIIMLVIAAETDIHNQSTLKQLKTFDESGDHTIGIITKPDVAEAVDVQRPYIQLALNQQKSYKLDLGWHVLRNRDVKDKADDFAARDSAETTFFAESSWATIPRWQRGVGALRVRLSKIQFDHLRRSIPSIILEMKTKLTEREEELDRLGSSRSTVGEIRNFLNKKADAFKQLATEAVEGRYHEPFFRRSPEQYKLRAQLRNFSAAFDYTLRAKGAERSISREHENGEDDKRKKNGRGGEDEEGSVGDFALPDYLKDFLEANPYPFPDPEEWSFEDLSNELNKEAAKTRGLEFPGSTNDNLALRLFQRQSQKWEAIAEHHITQVMASARLFVEKAMEFLVGPVETDRTTDAILRIIVDEWFEKRERLLKDKLEEFVLPYREAYALPADREFLDMRKAKLEARRAKELNAQDVSSCEGGFRISDATYLKFLSPYSSHHRSEFAPDDVLDVMETYYELSRRTFTDNIVNLAVESCLVRRIQYIFTPTSVGDMTDERVKELAEESDHVKARRQDLIEESTKLKDALKICNRYRPRNPIAQKNITRENSPTPKAAPTSTDGNSTPGRNEKWAKTTSLFQNAAVSGAQKPSEAPSFSFNSPPSGGLFGHSSRPTQNGAASERKGLFGNSHTGNSGHDPIIVQNSKLTSPASPSVFGAKSADAQRSSSQQSIFRVPEGWKAPAPAPQTGPGAKPVSVFGQTG